MLSAGAMPGQPMAPSAAEYLGLTTDQVKLFTQKRNEYMAWRVQLTTRLSTVREEIGQELAREPQDALAIGLRYAELETIGREYAARTRATITDHQALLQANQASRLESLLTAERLSSWGPEAACLYLSDTSNVEEVGICHRYPDARSVLIAAGKTAARRTDDQRTAVEEFLQLTPEQITRYRANQKSFTNWIDGEYTALLTAANGEACQALESSPLEPPRIGRAIVGLSRLGTQRRERGRQLIAANQALLTSEQRMRLRILEEARDLAPLIRWAQYEGFFDPGHGAIQFSFSSESWEAAWGGLQESSRFMIYPYCPNEQAP